MKAVAMLQSGLDSSKIRLPVLVIVAVVAAFSLMPRSAQASNRGFSDKVVVVIVDRVDILELPGGSTPFCNRLASDWSIGLMSARTPGASPTRLTSEGSEYVSLGAGEIVMGAPDANLGFDSGELFQGYDRLQTAWQLFYYFTGMKPPPAAVVCLGWQEVMSANRNTGGEDNPGLLGSEMASRGMKSAVVGNSDSYSTVRRFAPLVCCDRWGTVSMGDVSNRTQAYAPDEVGGYRVDREAVLRVSEEMLGEADLLVVDTGDTHRVDTGQDQVESYRLEVKREQALERVDSLARGLYELIDVESSLFIVLSPGPPADASERGNNLTPVIVAGRGFERGLLTSRTTRRDGLVSNVDFLPTVLEFFGAQAPNCASGAPITSNGADGSIDYLRKLYSQLDVSRRARWPLVIAYPAAVLLSLAFLLLCIPAINERSRWPRRPERLARFLSPLMVILLAVPLSFIAVAAFDYETLLFPVLFCTLFPIVVGTGTWWLQRKKPRLDPVVTMCLLTSGVILADLLLGGRLLTFPLLGVSYLEGMRYFGLTNTFVGLLVAFSIWAVVGLFGEKGLESTALRLGALAVMVVLSFAIGLGALGANLGGFITALATALLFFLALSRQRITKWHALVVTLVTAAGAALMITVDWVLFQTHASQSLEGGLSGFVSILERKIDIQVAEVTYFLVPTVILIVAVVVLALAIRGRTPFPRMLWEKNRPQAAALFSLLVGGLVAMLFNDTGITILAAMMLVSTLSVAYYLVSEFRPISLPVYLDPYRGSRSGIPLDDENLTPGG